MTFPDAGTWGSSAATPPVLNTALVLEFRCLYTADLRRKQKRWQDGRLKYHTFNKRIMVYDDRSNFVGDSHWREDHEFKEGEEVELERCGIIVEVSECVGARKQDLTSLLNKAVKVRQGGACVRAIASSTLRPSGLDIPSQTFCLSRADAKRRKPDNSPPSKNGYAQNLTGATLALSETPSTVAPLRYDSAWLRSMRQPTEKIDVPDNTGMNCTRRAGPFAISVQQTKNGRNQAEMLPNMLPPNQVSSEHARSIIRAAPTSARKTPAGRRLPLASGHAKMATTRLGQSDATAITTEEDEFIDIDHYDKENMRPEELTMGSTQVTNPAKNVQKKYLSDSSYHQPNSEAIQPVRLFNPLRIKTRPKRRLLLTANPPSRPPSFNEPSVEGNNGKSCPLTCPNIGHGPQLSLVPGRETVSIAETVSLDNSGHTSYPPTHAGMDHHDIDVLCKRKVSLQTSSGDEQQAIMQKSTNNIKSTECTKEYSQQSTRFEGKESTLPRLTPNLNHEAKQRITQGSRQLLTLRSNTETEIVKASTGHPMDFRSPPRFMKSFTKGAHLSGLVVSTIMVTTGDDKNFKPTYQVGRDPTVKRDALPFKPPAKLTRPITEATNFVKDNKHGGDEEDFTRPMIDGTGPAVPNLRAKSAYGEAVRNRDQGPWTREAFDLFDWRPGAGAPGNSLAAG